MAEERKPISVEDFVDGAIIEGFQRGSRTFMESLEDQLRTNVMISEAGDAQSVLQNMIQEADESVVAEETTEQIQELSEKLSRIIKRK